MLHSCFAGDICLFEINRGVHEMTFFEPAIEPAKLSGEPAETVALRKQLSKWCKAKEPKAVIMTITPDLAKLMLERNLDTNRTQSGFHIGMYRREIAEHRMTITNQGIGFDMNGRLCDGQHRLQACVQSAVAFDSVVVFGLSPDAFMYVDSGYKRTAGHKLGMDGFPEKNNLAAAARAVLMAELSGIRLEEKPSTLGLQPLGNTHDNRIPDEFIVDFCRETPAFVEMRKWYQTYIHFKPVPRATQHAVHWLIQKKHPQLAGPFMEQFALGESLNRTDNVYRLREHLLLLHMSGKRLYKAWVMAWMIDAFNDTRRGKATKFVMIGGRDFPKVLS